MKISIANIFHFSLDRESMLNAMLCVMWAAMLFTYMRGIINHLPVLHDFTEEVIVAIVVLSILISLPSLVNKFCIGDYLFFFINVLYYLSCYLFFPDNSAYLTENAYLCLCCTLPFYFFGRIVDIKKSFSMFTLLSTICICMDLFYFLIYAQQHDVVDDATSYDNMYAAYQVLPHVMFMLWTTLKRFRIWKAVISFFGILFLLSCGTRGPFVCLGFFGLVYFFFFMKFKGAVYVKAGIITTILILFAYLKEIIYYLVKSFTGLNLSTRILEKIISGNLGNDSYRSVLREKLYAILDSGDHFWGLGMFGSEKYDIAYSHFLPLDFFFTYGYFVGSVLMLLLALFIVWAFKVSKDQTTQVFLIFLFSNSIVKLMLSGTFVNEPYFYLLIGACARQILLHYNFRWPIVHQLA